MWMCGFTYMTLKMTNNNLGNYLSPGNDYHSVAVILAQHLHYFITVNNHKKCYKVNGVHDSRE